MHDDVSSGFKIATTVVVLMFIITMGLVIMLIGRAFFNESTSTVEAPLNSVADTDLYFMAAHGNQGSASTAGTGKPIPVANIARWLLDDTNAGNVYRFYIYTRNVNNPNVWVCAYMYEKGYAVPTIDCKSCLEPFMAQKAYITWSRDVNTSLYQMEVYID